MQTSNFTGRGRALLVVGLLGGLCLAGCQSRSKKQQQKPVPAAIQISAEDYTFVEETGIRSGPSISGTLTSKKQAVLRAQLSAAVVETLVEQGENVKAGQSLARLDEGSLRKAIASAELEVATANSNQSVVNRDLGRQNELAKVGAVSKQDIDASQQATVAAKSRVGQAQAQLASARQQLDYAKVKAPFKGVVSERHVSAGDVVQMGAPLYTVIDPSSLELAASITAEQLSQVAVGTPVEFRVTGYPNRTFRGTLTRINPTADPVTRQIRVYAELDNKGRALVSGLYAEGRVESESKTALTLPEVAIDRRLAKPAVLRVDQGKVDRVDVELGLVDHSTERVEIVSGLKKGDTVLLGAAQELAEGTVVHLKKKPQSQDDKPAKSNELAQASSSTELALARE